MAAESTSEPAHPRRFEKKKNMLLRRTFTGAFTGQVAPGTSFPAATRL